MPPGGYAWWYLDALSEDGARALSVIGFVGSVFSPWYAWSGRRDPAAHCCMNLAMSGPGARWAMTDRGAGALARDADRLAIGPSAMRWEDGGLTVEIDERSWPRLDRVRGTVRVTPAAVTGVELPLTPDGAHVWRPFAPTARVSVTLDRPGWDWTGAGYLDGNFGTRPLETDFAYWGWARLPVAGGTRVVYEAERRDGTRLDATMRFDRAGGAAPAEAPPAAALPRSRWGVRRSLRADPGPRPRQVRSMLDAPFYSRAAVRTVLDGEETLGVHEALDLDRFRHPLMKPLLAFKVPRRPGG